MPVIKKGKQQGKGKGGKGKGGGNNNNNNKGKGKGGQAQKKGNNNNNNNNSKNQNQNKNQNNNNNKNNNNKNNNNNNNNAEEKIDDSLEIRGINVIPLDEYKKKGQTYPPSKTVKELFNNAMSANDYPVNQTMPHPGKEGKLRMESDERVAIENEAKHQLKIFDLRQGAEIHRQVRQAAQHYIKPGRTMVDICNFIESNVLKLTGYNEKDPFLCGYGFPTGCSLNHVAAHYTPNTGDKTILKKKDLCKIDFGVQINGNIIDCAFSMSFDSMHDQLMAAVKAATNEGIKTMGIDVRLCDVGEAIQEVMESHECIYNNKTYQVKSIKNLCGHNIGKYIIHSGKSVPIVKNGDTTKMEEGELFAIETFGSTGKGQVHDDGECSHYGRMQDSEMPNYQIDHKGARDLLKWINGRFGTIPFCRRWLDDEGQKRHIMSLKNLVDYGFVRAYPPLVDQVGCYTAQYEHTIYLRPTCKEVVSRGMDY